MNWDALGAAGEILGAIAVVATIVYLARQVRDNSTQVKLNTTQSYAALVQDAWVPIYNDKDTIRIWHHGQADPDALNESELKTFYLFMDRLMNNAIPLLAHYEAGVISEAEFEHYRAFYLFQITTAGGSKWHGEGRFHFPKMIEQLRDA